MKSIRRTVTGVAAGALLAGGMVAFTAPSASANIEQCTSGHACAWGENTYTGCFTDFTVSNSVMGDWEACSRSGITANNGANSVKNYISGRNVTWYEETNYNGVGIRFQSQQSGANYQDPKLSNGGGTGVGGNVAGQNWQDRISSVRVS
ncbi:hypothetical protein SAMN04488544_3315 [Microlunatus sagamiharensis]|uniref:Peptidase inhibitor family I36 n=1 Tax=Microlunatus sagamiharensis TaxID=546874 RepID=A0A1H2N598_9ACTN|nr:peptidase inhibitor family I36 protein [Microlunatus sagamiharensis]SDV00418.1 hypothetical protein SAMN04488544_3315 [Microlunatus sagamiharensis]